VDISFLNGPLKFTQKAYLKILKPQACISRLPRTLDNLFTKQGYEVTYLLSVKVFNKSSAEALFRAEQIANSLRKNKRSIPLLNEDGSFTGNTILLEKVECDIVDDKVAAIHLQWNSYYPYN
jgi:hypothetical protein